MRFSKCEIAGLEERPSWWQVRPSEIMSACKGVRRGRSEVLCETPMGWPVYGVFYGDFSEGAPQSNWSAGEASRGEGVYCRDPESKPTLMWCAGVHGAEAESVAGAMNMISLLETGKDLRGKERPKLVDLLSEYRFIILPCVNMDGRSISPDHLRNVSYEDFRRASQGIWKDGSLIGWLGSKEHFPLPLDEVAYPGGYPNADGFNIMHDACPGHMRTAEAKAVMRLTERCRVDVVINGHSCEGEPTLLVPNLINYPRHVRRGIDGAYTVNMALYEAGLRPDLPKKATCGDRGVNMDTLFMLASGAYAQTLECTVYNGLSFDQLLEVCYVTLEALLESGHDDPLMDRAHLYD